MVTKTRERCPLCGSTKINLFRKGNLDPRNLTPEKFRITDSRYGTRWTLFECRECSFVFSNPVPNEKMIVDLYARLEDREYSGESQGRAKNFSAILKALKKLDPPGNTLLDVGAASGIFMNLARQHGYQVEGIEPSDYLVREAKALYGLRVFKGTLAQFKSETPFAVITLLDILEHLTEPHALMRQVKALIQPDGILVIVTPDIHSIAARISAGKWWHYRTAHINFFNSKSLSKLLEMYGFEILRKRRFAWHFSLYYLLTRLAPRLKDSAALQKYLKKVHLKLQLFDSWEFYAKKIQTLP